METVVGLLLGGCLYWIFSQHFKKSASPTGADAQISPADTATPDTSAESEPESLAIRLHRIDDALDPFARNAAHANELSEHPQFKNAVALLADPETPLSAATDYALGQTWTLSCAALAALKKRPDGSYVAEKIPAYFDNLSVWQMHFALDYLASAKPRPPVGAPLIGCRDWWLDNRQLQQIFIDYFSRLSDAEAADVGAEVEALSLPQRQLIKSFLNKLRLPLATRMAEKLAPGGPADVADTSSAFLSSIGRFWASAPEQSPLIEPEAWKDALTAAEGIVNRMPARALMVTGEPLSGKSSFLKLLGQRVGPKGWRVFEASAADLQAGQLYIGQLEGRIRQALEELDVSRKLIWYVPDLLGFALSGTHQGQSASILDQILPALSSGRVMIWTETTPAGMARVAQLRPALRRVLEIVRLEDMPANETIKLAEALAKRLTKASPAGFDASFSRTAVDVAQHYLNAMSLPGAALTLMNMTAQRLSKSTPQRLTGGDILETLSQMTGLPLSLLDGAERLDLASIRAYFADRVIGQPEAITSIVDRIAMLKSGLNDPGKPIGVFLFAGPTGTGKTELAKTVAEYLFGSIERMIRLDMSEFQTFEAVPKILGGGGLPPDADTLIARIRKQPFSLVLLDEFEKSHPQIWDLFLQVFDDGRLTDAYGQVADFRHCLIILTTNLGATAHRDSGIGFTPSSAGFTNDQIMRAISQTFRPEFQNRLDKVIVFKPLTRELMRGILKKELDRVFERRGLKDRAWAVEWDASALEFLLEKGFTPEMGARPLKRAIDQYLIAPLAATIVERRFPSGDQFVFLRRDGDALRADFVDPDGDGEATDTEQLGSAIAPNDNAPGLFDIMRAPSGDKAEQAALAEALDSIADRIDGGDWTAEKARLSSLINAPEFWSDQQRFLTLAKLELMDRLAVATETAHRLHGRLPRRQNATGKSAREIVARLAMQIHLVEQGLKDLDDGAPAEAALIVEPVFNSPGEEGEAERMWCADILAMYRAWAAKRNMTLSELDGVKKDSAPVLLVSGFGAYRTLARESGLHVLDGIESTETTSRMTARVLVSPVAPGATSTAAQRQVLNDTFAKMTRPTAIVRRYRRTPSPLVRNADGSWRSGKMDDVLAGDFDMLGSS